MKLKDKIIDLFCEIASVPRTTGNTTRIINYLKRFALQNSLKAQILGGNLIISIPATPGFEDNESIIIQANCDMTGIKSSDNTIDFLNDPIPIMVSTDRKYLKSNNSNLGAESSIALVYFLLLMEEHKDFDHPKIYLIITRDKGLNFQGVRSLDLHTLDSAKSLIEIVPQNDEFLLTGSTGGQEITGTYHYDTNLSLGYIYEISISDLRGGHDDAQIMQLHGAQAAKLIAQVIAHVFQIIPLQLISFDCPGSNNIITNQGKATFISSGDKQKITDVTLDMLKLIANCYGPNDPNIKINLTVKNEAEKLTAFTQDSTVNILFNIMNIPYGVINTVNGFPASSINLSSTIACNNSLTIKEYLKYSDENYGNYVRNKVIQYLHLTGAQVQVAEPVPIWKRKEKNKLQDLAVKVKEKVDSKPFKVVNIYDTLEIGVISQLRPDLDFVAFGPTIIDYQTINEKVDLDSTIKVYNYLKELIKETLI